MSLPKPTYITALLTYFSYMILYIFGQIRDFIRHNRFKNENEQIYAPIRQDYEDFYTRRFYHRIHDCWNRPIATSPTSWFDIFKRVTDKHKENSLTLTGEKIHCLNLASYDYLGFASYDEYCTPKVINTLESLGWGTCSSRSNIGNTFKHYELDNIISDFLGVESAITFGMGFVTNSFVIPALVSKGCLVISDSLNHASIVSGVRGSGANVSIFRHNDMKHLEEIVRFSIAEGQPRTRRPWKKIIIIVEGIYSMEGDICSLKEIVKIKKLYGVYVYLDEAHSIGALGKTGRGVCEYHDINPKDIDIMMGTFTKSFGSCGGYIAGNSDLIDYIKNMCPSQFYASSMSPPSAEQIISAIELITDNNSGRGKTKLRLLKENANYFRKHMINMGYEVLGNWDSPVVPIMLYMLGKIPAFSRACLERNIAIVVVGFPATTLMTSRARFCISASHTTKDINYALEVLKELSELYMLKYDKTIHL